MKTVQLGEVAEIVSGATPKTAREDYWGGDILWATPADLSKLDGAYISSTPRTITKEGLRSCAAQVLPPGSVLLSSRAPIGHVAINTEPMATNQGFKSLIPHPDRVDAKYLYHWLRAHTEYLQSIGNGATFKEVSKAVVSKVQVPLPPLDEQRRIAAILDQAGSVRQAGVKATGHLDELVQSAYFDMFGTPLRESAQKRKLGDVCEVVTGNTPSRSDAANYGDEIEWIKSDNLVGTIASRADEFLSTAGKAKARIAPAGAVLVTCIAGSPASIGRCSLVDRDVAFNQQINAAIPNAEMDSRFLLEQLKLAPELVRRKSTGGMKGLVSKTNFMSIEVQVPPLEHQREFVAFARKVDAVRTQRELADSEVERAVCALQSRAFSGQL